MSETGGTPVVRLAELEIDPAQLDVYKTLLREEIAASFEREPGVRALYAVAIKGRPSTFASSRSMPTSRPTSRICARRIS